MSQMGNLHEAPGHAGKKISKEEIGSKKGLFCRSPLAYTSNSGWAVTIPFTPAPKPAGYNGKNLEPGQCGFEGEVMGGYASQILVAVSPSPFPEPEPMGQGQLGIQIHNVETRLEHDFQVNGLVSAVTTAINAPDRILFFSVVKTAEGYWENTGLNVSVLPITP